MVNFDVFRRRSDKEGCERHKFETMVDKATSFCKVVNKTQNKVINVSLMFSTKEFYNEVVVYSMHDNTVVPGDYLQYGDRTILIIYKLESVKGNGILDRFKGVMCNYTININDTPMPACITFNRGKTVAATHSDDMLSRSLTGFTFDGEAIVVVSNLGNVGLGQRYIIGNRQWRVMDYDDITNNEIVYISLKNELRTGMFEPEALPEIEDDSELDQIEQQEESEDENIMTSGFVYRVNTERGYFRCDHQIEIIEKQPTFVRFKAPFGVKTITITTLVFNNEEENTYSIRST